MGAGSVNHKFRDFEKNYTDAGLFTKRQLSLLSHYPGDKRCQLTDEPITRSVFINAPSVYPAAVVLQVLPGRRLARENPKQGK